jgi:hypothetical protein
MHDLLQPPSLEAATEAYQENLHSPELTTAFWEVFWTENGKKASLDLAVPQCPWDETQIKEMAKRGKAPIVLPEEVSTQESRHLLGQMFPKMNNHSTREGNAITNKVDHFGWRQFDTALDAPHAKKTEDKLREIMTSQGDEEPTLNEYIVASQASKLLTGHYLDEKTVSIIFGSLNGGGVVGASFHPDGELFVRTFLSSGFQYWNWGGRFSRE